MYVPGSVLLLVGDTLKFGKFPVTIMPRPPKSADNMLEESSESGSTTDGSWIAPISLTLTVTSLTYLENSGGPLLAIRKFIGMRRYDLN